MFFLFHYFYSFFFFCFVDSAISIYFSYFPAFVYTITLKMAYQGRSERYVVLTIILRGTNFAIWQDMKPKFISYL